MQTISVKHGIYNIHKRFCYRKLSKSAVDWFLVKHKLFDTCVLVNLQISEHLDCWGTCHEGDNDDYIINVATDQSIRDFLATLMHELVHVLQWERGTWEGDGEEEAERKQYKLADKFWKEGML